MVVKNEHNNKNPEYESKKKKNVRNESDARCKIAIPIMKIFPLNKNSNEHQNYEENIANICVVASSSIMNTNYTYKVYGRHVILLVEI